MRRGGREGTESLAGPRAYSERLGNRHQVTTLVDIFLNLYTRAEITLVISSELIFYRFPSCLDRRVNCLDGVSTGRPKAAYRKSVLEVEWLHPEAFQTPYNAL